MKYINKIGLFFLLSITFIQCEKEVFEPFNKTEFVIEIQRDRLVDTLYRVTQLDVNSSDDYILSDSKIKLVDNNNNIIFNDSWQKLRNFTISLHERKEFVISVILYIEKEDEKKEVSKKTILLDNRNYPSFIKITKIEIDYDLSTISNLSYNFLTLIEAHYRFRDAKLVYNYFKYVQPNLNTYYPFAMNLKTRDKQNGPYWLDYELVVNYAKGSGNTFYGYENFDVIFKIKTIIESGNIDPNKTYLVNFPAQVSYDAGFKITYKCIYEN